MDYVLVKADFRGPEYAPSGWGTAKPVNLPWSPGRLTELARDRLTSVRRASRDLTTAPVLQAPPVPVGFTLGARDVRGIGLTHARRPPVEVRPLVLGPAAEPALHYPLGDGSDAGALVELRRLADHLRAGVPGAEA